MDWCCCDSPKKYRSLGQCRQVQKAGRRGASIVSTVHQRSAELHLWITWSVIWLYTYIMHTSWLVVLKIFQILFHINWEFHHPNWRTHIFQRGIETTGIPPTRKKIRQYHVICMWCLQEMVGHLQPPSFPETNLQAAPRSMKGGKSLKDLGIQKPYIYIYLDLQTITFFRAYWVKAETPRIFGQLGRIPRNAQKNWAFQLCQLCHTKVGSNSAGSLRS